MLGPKEKAVLRWYWRRFGTYNAIKISTNGAVMAQKSAGGAWGILETPEQAKRSAAELIKRDAEYLRWKKFDKTAGRRVRKR